jgi:hypothetical protein
MSIPGGIGRLWPGLISGQLMTTLMPDSNLTPSFDSEKYHLLSREFHTKNNS